MDNENKPAPFGYRVAIYSADGQCVGFATRAGTLALGRHDTNRDSVYPTESAARQAATSAITALCALNSGGDLRAQFDYDIEEII